MIPPNKGYIDKRSCKPRASGDDPTVGSLRRVAVP